MSGSGYSSQLVQSNVENDPYDEDIDVSFSSEDEDVSPSRKTLAPDNQQTVCSTVDESLSEPVKAMTNEQPLPKTNDMPIHDMENFDDDEVAFSESEDDGSGVSASQDPVTQQCDNGKKNLIKAEILSNGSAKHPTTLSSDDEKEPRSKRIRMPDISYEEGWVYVKVIMQQLMKNMDVESVFSLVKKDDWKNDKSGVSLHAEIMAVGSGSVNKERSGTSMKTWFKKHTKNAINSNRNLMAMYKDKMEAEFDDNQILLFKKLVDTYTEFSFTPRKPKQENSTDTTDSPCKVRWTPEETKNFLLGILEVLKGDYSPEKLKKDLNRMGQSNVTKILLPDKTRLEDFVRKQDGSFNERKGSSFRTKWRELQQGGNRTLIKYAKLQLNESDSVWKKFTKLFEQAVTKEEEPKVKPLEL